MSIKFKDVDFIYSENTPYQFQALHQLNLTIKPNLITAIVGKTGCGKSTMVQHLNGLLAPTNGSIEILDRTIIAKTKTKNLKSLRKKVGLVFQFPEYQLFEETILKDVSFGPKNFNVSVEEAEKEAKKALDLVGIDESYYERSPLELSGGQKRRIAIAGILAMNPEILVLDEPTAGLDPQGAKQMMQLFRKLNVEYNKTILIVTHNMEDVLTYCDEVVVLDKGSIMTHQVVKDFFKNTNLLEKLNILPPFVIRLRDELISKGFDLSNDIIDIDILVNKISEVLG